MDLVVLAAELAIAVGGEVVQLGDGWRLVCAGPNAHDLNREPLPIWLIPHPIEGRRVHLPPHVMGGGCDVIGGDVIGLHDHRRPFPR